MSLLLIIIQLLTMLTNKILAKKWINQQHTSSGSSLMRNVNGKAINNSHNKNIMMNSFMKNKIFQSIPMFVNQPSGSVVKVVTDIDDTVWSSGGVR